MTTTSGPSTFYLPGDYPIQGAAVIIERDSDRYVYDFGGDKTFKPLASATNPYVPLAPDADKLKGRLFAQIDLTSAFVDGVYLVNYTRSDLTTCPVYSMASFTVLNGSTSPPVPLTTEQIAMAFLKAPYKNVTDVGSVAALLAAMQASQTNIGTKMSSMEFDMGNIATRMNNVSSKLADLFGRQAALDANQNNTQSAVTAIQAQLNAMAAQVSGILAAVNDIQQKVGPVQPTA